MNLKQMRKDQRMKNNPEVIQMKLKKDPKKALQPKKNK